MSRILSTWGGGRISASGSEEGCLSLGPGGVYTFPLGKHPLRQTPPRQTPLPLGRHPQADTPGRHPPGRRTPPADTYPAPTPHPPEAATAADGTHPTGMHSCFNTKFSFLLHCVTEGWLGKQWRIQDFPEEGAPTLQGGANIRFCQIFPKTA